MKKIRSLRFSKHFSFAGVLSLVGALHCGAEFKIPNQKNPTALVVPEVHVRISKVHGVWHFLQSLAERPNTSAVPREMFAASRFATPAARSAVSRFAHIRGMLAVGGNFSGFPAERGVGYWLEDFFSVQAGLSRDLDDFAGRTLALLPAPEHGEIIGIMRNFERAYEALLGAPSRKALTSFREQIADRMRSPRYREGLRKIGLFYGARWPEGIPLLVSLVPLPGKGQSFAHRYGAFQEYEVRLGDSDISGHLSTITHEICHSMFDSQPRDLQHRLDKAFRATSNPSWLLAYGTINEALATALGDAWMYAHLGGALGRLRSWYNERYIDGLARSLFPKVTDYLETGNVVDEKFAAAAVNAFAKTFPTAERDLTLRFRRYPTILLTDRAVFDRHDVLAELKKRYLFKTISAGSPIGNEYNASVFAANPVANFMIVVSPGQIHQLGQLLTNIPELRRMFSRLPPAGSFLFASIVPESRAVVVIRADDLMGLKRALDRLSASEWKAGDWLLHF